MGIHTNFQPNLKKMVCDYIHSKNWNVNELKGLFVKIIMTAHTSLYCINNHFYRGISPNGIYPIESVKKI